MAAVVTDQFRILNAENFVASVGSTNNSYYAFLGLVNSQTPNPGFGRTDNWDTNGTPAPVDNFQYRSHYRDTALFGKKLTLSNVRRVVRKINWTSNTSYDMYRHDYSLGTIAEVTGSARLYDSNYYVINSDFRVYICIDNGSTGSISPGKSLDEPTFTGNVPTAAGSSNDGYVWKYLFTTSPSDIIKFDSTEYIVLPNDWTTTQNSDIVSVRNAASSTGQIKKVFIQESGDGYANGTTGDIDILGDGTGGKVSITVKDGSISDVEVTNGGSGYTYGIINFTGGNRNAKLIPIIPPSTGHGADIYQELGADRVLLYARFDASTNDFPTNTKFAQVGVIKNPTNYSNSEIYTDNTFSSLGSIKLADSYTGSPTIGEKVTQTILNVGTAKGYVASYDTTTKVLKYYQDRSLYFSNNVDQTDNVNVASDAKFVEFSSSGSSLSIKDEGGTSSVSIDTNLNESFVIINNKRIDLGVTFVSGLADPEINKKTGDVIYIDNRPTVTRDSRQKEDVKIILEF